jgi:hypothetical protein
MSLLVLVHDSGQHAGTHLPALIDQEKRPVHGTARAQAVDPLATGGLLEPLRQEP